MGAWACVHPAGCSATLASPPSLTTALPRDEGTEFAVAEGLPRPRAKPDPLGRQAAARAACSSCLGAGAGLGRVKEMHAMRSHSRCHELHSAPAPPEHSHKRVRMPMHKPSCARMHTLTSPLHPPQACGPGIRIRP